MRSFTIVLIGITCWATPAFGQRAPASSCTDVATDSTHPVLRAIDAQYAKLAEAIRARDVDALFALYMPDYHVVMAGGEVWSRERSLEAAEVRTLLLAALPGVLAAAQAMDPSLAIDTRRLSEEVAP